MDEAQTLEKMLKWTDLRHNERGEEILDPTPIQPPLGYKRPPTLSEQIRAQVVAAKLDELYSMEETQEEADDFEVGDDFTPLSPHENDHIPNISDLKKQVERINNQIQAANLENYKKTLEEEYTKKHGRPPPKAASPESDLPADNSET